MAVNLLRRSPHELPRPALRGERVGVRGSFAITGLAENPPHPDRKSDPTSPRLRLSDSHILKPQFDPELDALEGFEAEVHHFGTGFAVVGGPPAKPGDDPGRKGKCAFGMRVFLPNGLAFELVADRFQNALII